MTQTSSTSSTSSEALSFFLPEEKIVSLEPLGNGNVNDSWLVATLTGNKYVLQRLNSEVFPDPGLVQNNLSLISRHLRNHPARDKGFLPVQLISNKDGLYSFIHPDGWWRLLSYIESITLNVLRSPKQGRSIGRTLGLFHQFTSTLNPSSLGDPLPGFHVTPLYLAQYDRRKATAIVAGADDCRDFIEDRRSEVSLLEDARADGLLMQRVIHGDPKVANFLFSVDGKVISLIDLDTVKPGLRLHDLGDCLRSCCNPLGEEVKEPDAVVFDQELFKAVLAGYSELELLTELERELLVDSVRLISFELGLRFYSDHLSGNRYFKASRPGQNLFRARVQFALVRSIEAQKKELTETVAALPCRS